MPIFYSNEGPLQYPEPALGWEDGDCQSTQIQYITRTPTIIPQPVPPTLLHLDETKSLQSPDNFKSLQLNTLLLRSYIDNLKSSLDYYESSIKELNNISQE